MSEHRPREFQFAAISSTKLFPALRNDASSMALRTRLGWAQLKDADAIARSPRGRIITSDILVSGSSLIT